MKRILLATLLLWCGCSRLLYYPTRDYLVDLKKMKVQSPREVTFSSLDGTRLTGWYFKNKVRQQPKGLIVFFHGNAENMSTHFAALHWILNEGYDYFIFDYQGYGKSQGSPSPKGTVEDGIAALCWGFLQQPSTPLIVFGQSLGGAVALRAVAEVKNKLPVSYVVLDSTFHSYKAVSRSVLRRSWLTWIFQPLASVVMNDRFAPKDKIAKISPIPLLVIHGDKDQVVDYRLGKKVFELARPPKEFISVPNGQHIDAFWKHEGKYRRELVKRLGKIDPHPPKTDEIKKAELFCGKR